MFDETGRDIFVADGIHYLQKLPKFGLEAGTGRIDVMFLYLQVKVFLTPGIVVAAFFGEGAFFFRFPTGSSADGIGIIFSDFLVISLLNAWLVFCIFCIDASFAEKAFSSDCSASVRVST